jgi:hypothetical protein
VSTFGLIHFPGIDIAPLSRALDWMLLATNDFNVIDRISYAASVPDVVRI